MTRILSEIDLEPVLLLLLLLFLLLPATGQRLHLDMRHVLIVATGNVLKLLPDCVINEMWRESEKRVVWRKRVNVFSNIIRTFRSTFSDITFLVMTTVVLTMLVFLRMIVSRPRNGIHGCILLCLRVTLCTLFTHP